MIPPAKKGERINAEFVNRIIDQANRSGEINVPGSIVQHGPGGDSILPAPSRDLFFDPSHMAYAVNTGTTDIEALTPAHIYGTSDKIPPPTSAVMLNRRVLDVRPYPVLMHRRNHGVIALDRIKVNAVGRVYLDGLCLAKITVASRRFLTFAGWKIIWEEHTAEVPSNADNHYAIVRYCGDLGFWALLTAATNVAANRWKYSWTEKEWTITASILAYSTPSSPRVGPFTDETVGSTGWAWNSTEMENTDTDTGAGWSDQIDYWYDTGAKELALQTAAVNPIGQTNAIANKYPVVWLEPLRMIGTGQIAYLFTGWNAPVIDIAGS